VKLAAGLKRAPDFPQGCCLLSRLEVVEHKGRQDPVEEGIGIRKFIRKSLVQLDGYIRPARFSSSARERFRIGIETNHSNIGIMTLDEGDEGTRTATDIENPVPGPNRGSGKQRISQAVDSNQLDQRII